MDENLATNEPRVWDPNNPTAEELKEIEQIKARTRPPEKMKPAAVVNLSVGNKRRKTAMAGQAEKIRAFRPGEAGDLADKPVILVEEERKDWAVREVMRRLMELEMPIFQRDGVLVIPTMDPGVDAWNRPVDVAVLIGLREEHLEMMLSGLFRWREGKKETGPNKDVIRMVLRLRGMWPFKRVRGLLQTPTLRWDGTLLDKEGYDEQTQMLLTNLPRMPVIPGRVTREMALAAVAALNGLLAEVPFANEGGRSVALSALLSTVSRAALLVAPLHAFTSPRAGSGKSWLANLVSAVATGRNCAVRGARGSEEGEKDLATALKAGRLLVVLDNSEGEVRSGLLCQAVTSPVISMRKMGTDLDQEISNGSVLMVNGNNLTVTSDFDRRTLVGVLDAKMEKPWEKEYRLDPIKMVLEERGKYVAAALMITLAYQQWLKEGGQEARVKRVNGFESWTRMVQEPLVWLGEADPAVTMAVAQEEDVEGQKLGAMLVAMAERFGLGQERAKTALQIIEAVGQGMAHQRGHTALKEAVAMHGDRVDSNKLGVWLGKNKDRIAGGLALRCMKDRVKVQHWWVVSGHEEEE